MCKFGRNRAICLRETAILGRALKCPYHVTFDLDLDLEQALNAGWPGDHRVQVWSQSSHLPARKSDFRSRTKVPVSRDLWPWPWNWAHPICTLTWRPSCASLVAIRPFPSEEKRFSCQHKTAPSTWPLTLTLTLSTPWMQAHLGTIVCKFGRNPAICLRQEAIFVIGTKAPVSRDLWPWPRPWAQHGCAPTCWPSCVSLVAIELFLAS